MDDVRLRLERLHAECFGWAMCCCGRDREAARDVLQDVYLKVLDGKARHDGAGSFKTWLFAVIRRTALDERRRTWVRLAKLTGYWQRRKEEAPQPLPPESQELAAALAKLPRQQREVVHLVFYEELSIAEAAEVMGVSVGTARTHYQRAKAALRDRLGSHETGRIDHAMGPGRTTDAGAVL